VEQWLIADEANLAYYNQLKKIWDESRQLASTSTVDENKAWQKFQKRIHAVPKRRTGRAWMRIAATVLVFAGIGMLTYWLVNNRVENVVVIAQDQVLVDTLPDASRVTINKGSSLSYPSKFGNGSRQVVLNGEAFFNVQPDKTKPFTVTVNDVQVTVLGTSFNIKSINGNTEVIVESGIVKVTRGNKSVELTRNEKLLVKVSDSLLKEEAVVDRLYKYYRTKEFVCDDTPLWKLIEVINEAYHSKVVIGNPALKDMSITTTFHNESLDQVLNIISITFDIKVVKEGDTIILK